MGAKTAAAPRRRARAARSRIQAALSAPPLPQYDISLSLEAQPLDDLKAQPETDDRPSSRRRRRRLLVKTASLFFGNSSLAVPLESMERWQPGEEPTIVTARSRHEGRRCRAVGRYRQEIESGESIAPKGEVNADNQRSKTPAERLGLLDDKTRAKAEKCLAEAVYFEARGEACAARSRWRRW